MQFPSDVTVDEIRHQPVCGIIVTAILTSTPFQTAKNFYKKHLENNGHRTNAWKGRLTRRQILYGITALGSGKVWLKKVKIENFSSQRLNKIIPHLKQDSVYIAFTRDHIQIIKGPFTCDQGGWKSIAAHYAARRRVEELYEVQSTEKVEVNIEISRVKEEGNMATKRANTKHAKATIIVHNEWSKNTPRKEILALLVKELDTTWGSASTFYHKILREKKKKEELVNG